MTEHKTRWGIAPEAWAIAVEQARAELVRVARMRQTITYAGLCRAVGAARLRPYSWALMALLDEACSPEDAEHGIVLASVVVRADSGMPGDGYFGWAERAGADVGDRREYWERQIARVYLAYSPHRETGG